eukprot:4993297-Pleurochrysis_carterae.AAC.2
MTRVSAISRSTWTPVSSVAPRAMHMAMEAPIEVPQMRSKTSRMLLPPRRRSSAWSTSVGLRPFTPPPSMHRMRSGRGADAAGGGGNGGGGGGKELSCNIGSEQAVPRLCTAMFPFELLRRCACAA